jgi:glyoxylase-like metal-dependent hydrolase (beta-lactamase superfamily II)
VLIVSSPLWLASTNCYAIAAEAGSQAVIVDAPPDPEGVIELLARHRLIPVALVVTHGHVDHCGGAGSVVGATGITAYVHPDDDFLTLDPGRQMQMMLGQAIPNDFGPPDYLALSGGETLTLAGIDFEVRHTPGHTPGHCCFFEAGEGLLFSGDQLFAGSIGRTDLPGGDTGALFRSMRDHVMTLDDGVRVLPGHGPETTIGRERRTNPFRDEWETLAQS